MSDARVAYRVPADHPSFAGHFPGAPVLPGVVLLAEVIDALRAHPALLPPAAADPACVLQVDHVKWLAPVGPGARLAIELAARDGGVAFDVVAADGSTAVARGRLSWQRR